MTHLRKMMLEELERAIPMLISLLGYRRQNVTFTPIHKQFPAVNVLSMMGKPVVPALLKVIADKENSSVESQNAVLGLMGVSQYRGQLGQVLDLLTQAGANESDPVSAQRLRIAADDARDKWCGIVSCDSK